MLQYINELVNQKSASNTSICLIEEMSELTQVLSKLLNQSKKFNFDNLLEKVAHVELMCRVLKVRYSIDENLIYEAQMNALKIAMPNLFIGGTK